jgi:UDP-N-acetylmuramate dehydrogenase
MKLQFEKNVDLLAHNTFGISAIAKEFARIEQPEHVQEALEYVRQSKNNHLVLGGGSNILFTQDVDAIVLQNRLFGIELEKEDDMNVYVRAAAGENWHSFVLHCIRNKWAGVENLSLIPGCVGASPMQNIGAYGVEMSSVLNYVEAVNIHTSEKHTFSLNDCELGYRESIFKRKEKGNWFITHVGFKLNKRPIFNIEYGAIAEELDKMEIDTLSIKHISQAVIAIRSSKLPDPKILGNAGSFFKNPTVDLSVLRAIQTQDEKIPFYPVNENTVKIPAGYMIEHTGWKGQRVGNCGVHEKQALVLVNYGGATGEEIYALSGDILIAVKNKYGIELEREVNVW